MKTLLFYTFLSCTMSFAQTNIIAAKSHASSNTEATFERDNFGDPMPYRTIQEVRYLKDDCIEEKYAVAWGDHLVEFDTICDHPFLQDGSYDLARMKAMYPENTKFKGFEGIEKSNDKSEKKLKKSQRRNQKNSVGLILFLTTLGGFLLFLFTPAPLKTNG